MDYDSWLEAPYQDAMEDAEAFSDWAETRGWDLNDSGDIYQATRAYEEWLLAEAEDQAIAQYEYYLERKAEEAQEREWDDKY
jgi:predicted TPR repeat methyltransferase